MNTTAKVLDKIESLNDLKTLNINELNLLADEMRELIIKKVNTIGGHFGPNLGIVETIIAMHYVFNSPLDKIVFDVSHQCYPHKILTGRKEGYTNEECYLKYTGYTAPEESEHDLFKVGHTSTSVSLAVGLAKGRDLTGGKENVIALIGDGSLTGGEALEGLNNAAVLNSNMIIVINDNDMSIAENQGGICNLLTDLRLNNGNVENNFFKSLGFEYFYVEDGHNIQTLIDMFSKVKDTNHPVVVHIHTIKGKGFKPAETDKEPFHWILPNTLNHLDDNLQSENEDYNSITKDYLLNKVKEDSSVVVMNAATPGVFGFDKQYRKLLGKNYVDVGIAEQHAVAMASGLAKAGAKPVLCVMSSFIQRTYDQLSQDLALNNSPATILVYWGGISSADATHLCTFDIPLISNIPNIVYLAPTCKEEYLKMLDWSVNQKEHSVVIRVPMADLTSSGVEDNTDYSVLNKFKMVEQGKDVALIGLGTFFERAKEVKQLLKLKSGIDATLINPKFITGLDEDMLNELKSNHKIVITLEDGELDGGFGEKFSRFYGDSDVKVLNYGSFKEFTDRAPLNELYTKYRLTPELIVEDIEQLL
ncbi:1-deoxy-D-xylulose-5-phosphate synthase [bacterium]|nr:1-deoxy-D-xylulose-5-phosphate synthase [bacterium]